MGTIPAQNIINAASALLYDIPQIKWPSTELLNHVNTGSRLISTMQPNSANVIAVVTLVAGARQKIPTSGWKLLSVIRNMGTSGTVPGQTVRDISRGGLSDFNPNWQTTVPPAAVVQSFMFDEQDDTGFFVYPPNTGTGTLEINYAGVPPDITDPTQPIQISDALETALLNFVMFKACSKAAPFAPGAAAASAYLNLFNDQLVSKATAESLNDPNLAMFPKTAGETGGES